MASARARLGSARRGIIQRKKTTGVVTGALGALGTVAAFGAGQMKKADTAWKEYEAGYGEVPGADVADIKKPGLFKRTMQQLVPGGKTGLPEGDVRIGDTLYDRSKIQKAGVFLGSDASAILDPGAREQYLKRVAPGRDLKSIQKPSSIPSSTAGSAVPPTTKPSWPTLQDYNQNVVQEQQGMGEGWLESLQLKQTMGSGSERGFSFAHGGDFITNGPQKILVGDNPGGRERVTIKPLPSKKDEEYKKRSLLESLYENNRKRKVY